ncbi:MAG: FHA domain-containing protein [Pseudomonadales bacterium]
MFADRNSSSSEESDPRSQRPNRVAFFFGELKRRQVFKVTSVYLVAAWGLSAGGAEILPALGLPEWTVRYLVTGLFAATPLVALLAWLYEISDRGIERDLGPIKLTEQDTVIATEGDIPVLTARWRNQERQFVQSFDIGRDEACAMQLVDPMISRRHARVEFLSGTWWLRDLGSANGTEVNGSKVDALQLEAGASVVFYPGATPLTIDISLPESATATVLAAGE